MCHMPRKSEKLLQNKMPAIFYLIDCIWITSIEMPPFVVCNLRVVFPFRGPGKPPGAEIPEKWGNLQNSRPRSDPEKLQKNYKNCIFGLILPLFIGQFSPFSGVGPGRGICNFYAFFGDFRPNGFPGPLRGKTTRNMYWFHSKSSSVIVFLRCKAARMDVKPTETGITTTSLSLAIYYIK